MNEKIIQIIPKQLLCGGVQFVGAHDIDLL